MIDFSTVKNSAAYDFLYNFFIHRTINREFYERVPIHQFDFRMTSKSDSIRESLAHQVNVQKAYLSALATGTLIFGGGYDKSLAGGEKEFLLYKLDEADRQLVEILSREVNLEKRISVPWSKERIEVLSMLWALNNHEILHTGWNIAVMDHLNMERFESLKKIWG